MNEVELKRLLEKYYNGISTEEEEMRLKEFFISDDYIEGYKAEKDIFGYYSEARIIPPPSDDFEARIISEIDNYEKLGKLPGKRKYILSYLSVAACVIILVSLYFLINQKSESHDTFNDPRIAYAETMKILLNVSAGLNRGTQALEPVGKLDKATKNCFKTINKPLAIVEKGLKNLEYIHKTVEIIKVPKEKNKN